MLDVTLLGTGGMQPLPNRYLTSLFVRFEGNGILIDCGEGTQMALRRAKLSPHNINTILLTHLHADHVSGLPGMLLTMGNGERTMPVKVYGPKGTARIISAVRTLAPELPFELEVEEYQSPEECFVADSVEIKAFKVKHNILCYGYSLSVKRAGRFDVDRANENAIPQKFWNRLQKGETIEEDGRIFTPDMVLGEERKGLKVVYSTDTRPTPEIEENAKNADLLILEGMYGPDESADKAAAYKHMTMVEAANIAKQSGAKEMWLTHFSPSVVKPSIYENEIKQIFENTVIPKDGMSTELRYENE